MPKPEPKRPTTIKLSKRLQEALSIQKEIYVLLEKYKELVDKMKVGELILTGALVVGIHSPSAEISTIARFGHVISTKGLVKEIVGKKRGDHPLKGLLDSMPTPSLDRMADKPTKSKKEYPN